MGSKILIISGEPSGDLHASHLVNNIKKLRPDVKFFGLGGPMSERSGVDIIFDISKLALVGLIEVLSNIFLIGTVFRAVLKRVDADRPDLAILVDYPGFNLRLARELRKRGIPVIYYISPQIWAWGKSRINIIRDTVKKVIVFFPFEERLYKSYGIDVECVGHPLIETVRPSMGKNDILKKYSLSPDKKIISLLPGSRMIEIQRLLPDMVKACAIIGREFTGAQFLIARHPDRPIELYEDAVKDAGCDIKLSDGDTYNLLSVSDFAVVASGTATLETTILGTPFVLVYKTNPVTCAIAKMLMQVEFLGITNIIAGKEVVPELWQSEVTARNIANAVAGIMKDAEKLDVMKEEFLKIRSSLGKEGASIRAANAILPFIPD